MCQVSHEKAEKGAFLPNFQELLFLAWNYTMGTNFVQMYKKKFVSFPVNEIQAYKYNILMTIQSAIASTVTVIEGILVCIVVRLPIGLPPAP